MNSRSDPVGKMIDRFFLDFGTSDDKSLTSFSNLVRQRQMSNPVINKNKTRGDFMLNVGDSDSEFHKTRNDTILVTDL